MPHKLLLADDSITIQKVVELTLSEEGFEVTAVGDGAAALDVVGRLMPDLILADVFMPKMDGYELCGRIKQDPALRHIPIILLAGTFENFDDALAAKVGADDHITKPFESADLISMAKRLVERSGSDASADLLAEPVDDAFIMPEAEPVPATDSDDLWSVVDMGSHNQPLAGAGAGITEDDLWQRANLVHSEAGRPAGAPAAQVPQPPVQQWQQDPLYASATQEWDDLEVAEVEPEAEVVEEAYPVEDEIETAAFADDDFEMATEADSFAETAQPHADLSDTRAAFLAGFGSPAPPAVNIIPPPAFEPQAAPRPMAPEQRAPEPAPQPARPAVGPEEIREMVVRAASSIIEAKVKEAIDGLSREMIEQVVWEVVPDLAEEIIVREIERLKAGAR